MEKITVMGCGYIGLPTAVTFAQAGYTVCGVDVSEEKISILSSGRAYFDEPGLNEALKDAMDRGLLSFSTEPQPADVFIISVPTPCVPTHDGKSGCQLDYVRSAAQMVGTVVKEGNLVVLESTSPPGTTREVEDIVSSVSGLDKDCFMTAHCPERVIPGNMLKELRENDRIIGSRKPETAEYAKRIYQPILTKGDIKTTDDLTAELCKLAENTYRDINIAFANELSQVCDKLGIDVFGLIKLTNCHPRVNVHSPGVGVGGHCIPVVPWFIHEKFEDDTNLILQSRIINDNRPNWVADKVAQFIAPPATVAVLGMTYKNDTDDLRDSAAVVFANILKERGYNVICCEPNAKGNVFEYENLPLEEALEKASFAVIALAHKEFVAAKEKIASVPHYDCVGLLS